MSNPYSSNPDVVLVGAGIMSATLAVLLKELNPNLTIEIFESLNRISRESSNAWNNAGTGHAALCELNYTPEKPDGSIPIDKAAEINEAFEISKQFWAYLVRKGALANPAEFINQVPHLSFVHGEKNVDFLKRRHAALRGHPFFAGMEYSDDRAKLAEWMPVMMAGRADGEPLAATRMEIGADVNFGTLTSRLIAYLQKQEGVFLHLRHRIVDLKRRRNGEWTVVAHDRMNRKRTMSAKFVFLGAGGGALPLLQKSGIREGKGYGGFP
ncbi:MAG TPA: FAD-dependent oxidoreductase, partial [Chthoniobacterales bacterium]